MKENDLSTELIEKVRVTEWEWSTTASFSFCRENQLKTKEDICFNIAYLLACAAYKHHPTRWFDSDVFQDPKIREFMQKVEKVKTPDQKAIGIEVVTKDGRSFMSGPSSTGVIRGGVEFPEEETKEQLLDKFINNASRTFSLDKANKIAQTVLELEKLDNMAKFMQILTP